jgi:hypothetical protein
MLVTPFSMVRIGAPLPLKLLILLKLVRGEGQAG